MGHGKDELGDYVAERTKDDRTLPGGIDAALRRMGQEGWRIAASIGGCPGPAYSIRGSEWTVEYEHTAYYGEGLTDHETLEVTEDELAASGPEWMRSGSGTGHPST